MNPASTDLDEFIESGARRLTPRQLAELASRLDDLRESLTGFTVPGYPRIEPQLRFLASVAEECAMQRENDLPVTAYLEAAFALLYLDKEVDLIPDFVGDIGLTDDAAIAVLVLARHVEAFARFARDRHIPWDPISPTPPA